jgi:GxxExxY protein
MEIQLLSEKTIGCGFRVHKHLGSGFLEKVYENALAWELREEERLQVSQQRPITVFYRGVAVGEYFADLCVEGILLVEIKAVRQLLKDHEVQLVHYLTATGLDHGLLINFGASVNVKHKYRLYRDPGEKKTGIIGCT